MKHQAHVGSSERNHPLKPLIIPGSSGYKCCSKSFIYSLVNLVGIGPTKLPLKTAAAQSGIYNNRDSGPTFGGGHDLYLCGGANATSNSYSNLNHSYECSSHITAKTFLAGSYNFTVSELEVFGYQE